MQPTRLTDAASALPVAPGAPRPAASGDFHIPSLDGLRAVSFLVVFLAHAGLADYGIPGGFGVTVFFFLSGYLITTLLRLEHLNSGAVSLRDFYLRRVLRILPPFYAVLLLALALTAVGVLPGALRPLPVLAQLGHFTNYWAIAHTTLGQPPGTGVYWSLAVEEHFYLVFPFLFLALQRLLPRRLRVQAGVLVALSLVVLAWRLYLVLVAGVSEDRTYLASDTRVDSILWGCALAVGQNPMLDAPRTSRRWLLGALLPAGTLLLLFCFVFRAPWFRETLRYTLQGIGLVPLFIAAMREPAWGPFRLLNLRTVKKLGALSYSLYLVHQVVLYGLEAWLPRVHFLLRGALALALSIAIAQAIHRFIEKPCARLRRRLAHATWLTAPAQQ